MIGGDAQKSLGSSLKPNLWRQVLLKAQTFESSNLTANATVT